MHPGVRRYQQVMAEAMPCESTILQACKIDLADVAFAEIVVFQGPMARALQLRADAERRCATQTLTSAFAEYLKTPARTFRPRGNRKL